MRYRLFTGILCVLLASLALQATDFIMSFGNSYRFGMQSAGAESTPCPPFVNCYFTGSGDKMLYYGTGTQTLNKDIRATAKAATWSLYSATRQNVTFTLSDGRLPARSSLTLALAAAPSVPLATLADGTAFTLAADTDYVIQFAEAGVAPVPAAPANTVRNMERSAGNAITIDMGMLPDGFTLAADSTAVAFEHTSTSPVELSFGSVVSNGSQLTFTLPDDLKDTLVRAQFYCWYASQAEHSVSANAMVTVELSDQEPYLVITTTEAEIPAVGGDAMLLKTAIRVESNVHWTVRTDVGWITLGTRSGSNINTVTYTVSSSDSPAPRTGHITIESDRVEPKVFTVTQLAAQLEEYTIGPFAKGWQYIALTYYLSEEDKAALLKDYTIVAVGNSGKSLEKASTLEPGVSYWLYCRTADAAARTVHGYELGEQWNQPVIANGDWLMVAVGNDTFKPADADTVWAWNADKQVFEIVTAVTPGKAYIIRSR